jgi:hypothetical protein
LGVAHAQEPPLITIPVDTAAYGAPGSEQSIAAQDVPGDLQGKTCMLKAEAKNNESVHPNSDLLVRSGGGEVTIPDVERASNIITDASGPLTLGKTVTVSVRFGPDLVYFGGEAHGVFSGGGTVTIDCTTSQPIVSPVEVHRPASAPDVAATPAQGSTEPSAVDNPATAVPAHATTAPPQFTG